MIQKIKIERVRNSFKIIKIFSDKFQSFSFIYDIFLFYKKNLMYIIENLRGTNKSKKKIYYTSFIY